MGFLFKITVFVTLFFAWLWRNHLDIIITLAPRYVDHFIVEQSFSREGKNTGITRAPTVSAILPTEGITKDNVAEIFHSDGLPVLVKGLLSTDQDKIVRKMTKSNAGKSMRMLDFENWTQHHFSISCSAPNSLKDIPFDEYSSQHLFQNVSHKHSYYYAGFEAITEADTINDITGLNIEALGDYKQNNLFTSNFPRQILTAPLHCAPIDSLSLQLIGTKTWFFVSPEDLATVDSVPMPTSFNLPLTDDELLSKIKNIYTLKQEPGDVLYFGPHWCHAVSTSMGPNLMMNLRYFSLPKIKKGPMKLTAKLLIRKYLSDRGSGKNPQDNKVLYPGIYDALSTWFNDCGQSEWFNSLHERVLMS